jgi:N-acetylglucosaminyldiphosphoundecaprenol N-acetyl-beta-D-mannosaminyltransferase
MTHFFDYTIRTDLPDSMPNDKLIINTINPHSFCVAEEDLDFKIALQKSDILIPDGEGIIWGVKLLRGQQIKKIAGFDLHQHLLTLLDKKGGGKVFYLGASTETLNKIKDRLAREFPTLLFERFSPPYKANFSKADNLEMIKQVNHFNPDVLFVGMTAPKQEKWVSENHQFLDAKIIASIGAVFDFYAGTVKRPSNFWIKLKMEWLVRLIGEPKRLFKRNFISTPQFIFAVLKEKWFAKGHSK